MGTSKERSTFSEIDNVSDMLRYVNDSKRLNSVAELCQYTKRDAFIGIIKSGYWVMSNPQNMNDLYEYQQYPRDSWKHLFFASFMIQKSESMAMWSMYAQPWEDGIRVSLPKDAFLDWAQNITCVYKADPVSKAVDETRYVPVPQAKVSVSRVLYASGKTLRYAGKVNEVLRESMDSGKLAGSVKDIAWEYENEVRLRVDLPEDNAFEAVAVKLPESIRSRLKVLKGPRYEGRNILTALPKEYRGKIDISESLFHEKLGWIPCDSCAKKEK